MKFPFATSAVLFAAFIACAASAQSSITDGSGTGAVSSDTIKTIVTAVAKADLGTLDALRQSSTDDATRRLAAMAAERIQGDFDKSSADAAVCARTYFDSAVQTALFCARFRIGNLRLAGRESDADQADQDMVKRFQSKLPAQQAQNIQNAASAYDALPVLSVQRPGNGFRIPLLYAEHLERNGGITETSKRDIAVTANGQTVNMRFATGPAYLQLDEDTARKLGVRILDAHVAARTAFNDKITAQTGVLDKLSFDGVTVENAPVVVVPRTVPTIGIGIIKYLGAMRITKDAIMVYGPNDPRPAGSDPILIGSRINGGNMHIVTSLTINGAAHLTVINTADPFYLTGSKGAMADLDTRFAGQLQRRSASNVRHGETIDRTLADVLIGGQPMRMKFGVLADENSPWNYQLGRSALQDMDIYLDFQHRRLALIPRSDIR
ncbi:MAG TPA: retropepsin-like aspartic protease [Dyella sp.]|uniref:retropepsin-like aspartic protease n=1 Tax=Dyella sp. TaxID=1869338 RepID=UPI002C83C4B3|nr:retropepsin-like aspartic protease [Dyella sp.]HTV85988.1 retropepsin-like aspartic protease [Dyella sp.]